MRVCIKAPPIRAVQEKQKQEALLVAALKGAGIFHIGVTKKHLKQSDAVSSMPNKDMKINKMACSRLKASDIPKKGSFFSSMDSFNNIFISNNIFHFIENKHL